MFLLEMNTFGINTFRTEFEPLVIAYNRYRSYDIDN